MSEINDIGGISLSLFRGIAMITLKLWPLAELALPLLLAGQTVLMFGFARYVAFNIMGRDYDAAVLSSGICGFGIGATPNAIANMQALSCSGKNEPTRSGQRRYRVEQEELAVPEIHTGRAHENTPAPAEETKPAEEPITYDGVAIPEIHLKRKRKP